MNVHLAETGFIRKNILNGNLKGLKFPILFSFNAFQDLETYHPHATSLIVDSGAFTFQQKGIKELNEYVENYKKFINKYKKYPNTWFVELDIENKVGYNNVKKIRKELLKITPNIIPVWHKERGLNDYKKTCKEFNYIGISGVNGDDLFNEKEMRVFVNYAHKHNTKVHGFGVHKDKTLKTVPFDSVDATSWCKATIFGNYKGKKLSSNYRRKHYDNVAFLEILNGIKKVEYYKKYWRDKINVCENH